MMTSHDEGLTQQKARSHVRQVVLAPLFIAIVGSLVAWFSLHRIARHRVTATVSNEGPNAIRSVVVHVKGRPYFLGDLNVGASRAVYVDPRGESNVEIEF